MRNSKVLARVRAGKPARIAHMGFYSPPFIAYAAHMAYDCVWLDLEHRAMDEGDIQALLAFCHKYDIDCMIRPHTREKSQLYRYLEDGATGFMIPHVGTADEARDLVNKVKFPPLGDRGIEGFGLETNYSLDIIESTHELVAHANRETFLIVQIKTPEGLSNVETIAAVPGVDGLFMGPFDLSVRMAHQPEGDRVGLDDAMARIAEAARVHSKAWGSFALSIDDIPPQIALGAQLISLGIDILLLKNGLAQCSQQLDDVIGPATG